MALLTFSLERMPLQARLARTEDCGGGQAACELEASPLRTHFILNIWLFGSSLDASRRRTMTGRGRVEGTTHKGLSAT